MALPLTDLVGQQAALLIVVVLAEQFALLALAFATATELVPGQDWPLRSIAERVPPVW